MGTINANFLLLNRDKLQVASSPEWKYKRLCMLNSIEYTSVEEVEF
jgi:hypothetical protein